MEKILIVDDSLLQATQLRGILDDKYDVTIAQTAESAVAKNLVAAGLCDRCELQFAYAIGVARPVSVLIDTFGTGKLSDDKLAVLAQEKFDLRPAAIMDTLGLRAPIYRQTAAYGHFGRPDLDLPWERTDRAAELAQYTK